MAQISERGRRRVAAAFMLASMLWSLSCAQAADDAAVKAERLRAKGDHAAAVKVLADAIKEDPLDQRLADMLRDSQSILGEERARLKREKDSREADALRTEARALYEKGDLDSAIRMWSQVLVLDPQDDSSAWMIQKAQTRKQLEAASYAPGATPRDYNKKIKSIADDITKLIDQAKEKLRQEGEERKRQELAALEEDAENEKRMRSEEERQSQEREEAFIAGTFKEGQELYARGKYDEALRAWEAILPLLSQDSELRAKISVLCAEIRPAKEPPAPKTITLTEAAGPVVAPVSELTTSPPVETTAPTAVSTLSSIEQPAETAVPTIAPPVVGKETVPVLPEPSTSAGHPQHSARIVIAIAIIVVFVTVILAVFYMVVRPAFSKRKVPIGEGFDPSKLASFLKNDKQGKKDKKDDQGEKQDKDIFKVR